MNKELSYSISYESMYSKYNLETIQKLTLIERLIKNDFYDLAFEKVEEALTYDSSIKELYTYRIQLLEELDPEKAYEAAEKFYTHFPSYLFAKTTYAKFCIKNNELDRIPQIFNHCFNLAQLYPDRDTFNIKELRAFTIIMCEYYIFSHQYEFAHKLIEMLGALVPGDIQGWFCAKTLDEKQTEQKFKESGKNFDIKQIKTALNKPVAAHVALYAARNHKKEVTPVLLEILQTFIKNIDAFDADTMEHIGALYLLAYFKEKEAFPLVVQIANLPGDQLDYLLDDVITDGLTKILVSTYNGDTQAIKSIIEGTTNNPWARNAALGSLLGLIATGNLPQEEVKSYIHSLYETSFIEDQLLASFWVEAACALHPANFLDKIQNLLEKKCIDLDYINKDYIDKCLLSTPERCVQQYIFNNPDYAPITEDFPTTLVMQLNFFGLHDIVPVLQEKGRNDPCLCTSTKKYKKCCIDLGEYLIETYSKPSSYGI